MNWIAQQFEALKARVEAHIPATHKALNDLDARVSAAESRVSALEELAKQLQKAPAP